MEITAETITQAVAVIAAILSTGFVLEGWRRYLKLQKQYTQLWGKAHELQIRYQALKGTLGDTTPDLGEAFGNDAG